MKTEKAIKVLKMFKELNENQQPKIVFDAIDFAISALEKQSEAINVVPATDRTGRCYVGNCPKCGGNVILRRSE